MATITSITIKRAELGDLSNVAGRLIYCSDTKDLFYDTGASLRININSRVERLFAYELDSMIGKFIENQLYYNINNGNIALGNSDGTLGNSIQTSNELESMIGTPKELSAVSLMKNNQRMAPRTKTNLVYDKYGKSLDDIIEELTGNTAVWSIGVNAITNRGGGVASGSGSLDALLFAGIIYNEVGGIDVTGITELFNGSSWSTKTPMNAAKHNLAGCGTSINALSYGGGAGTSNSFLTTTESYNNGVWSNEADMITPRTYLGGTGVYNSALSIGGFDGSYLTAVELFDGTIWSAKNNINIGRSSLACSGGSNGALIFGGFESTTRLAGSESFDGTNWSIGPDMNIGRSDLAGCGVQNATLSYGGYDMTQNYSSITESYNGVVWSLENSLNVARHSLSGTGTNNTNASSFGGGDFSIGYTVETYAKISHKTPIHVVDSLNDASSDKALSANMGKLLRELIESNNNSTLAVAVVTEENVVAEENE